MLPLMMIPLMISYCMKVDDAAYNYSGASDAGADTDTDPDGDDDAEADAFHCNKVIDVYAGDADHDGDAVADADDDADTDGVADTDADADADYLLQEACQPAHSPHSLVLANASVCSALQCVE